MHFRKLLLRPGWEIDRVSGEYGGLRLKEVARDQVGEAGGPAVGLGTESGQNPVTWGNKEFGG